MVYVLEGARSRWDDSEQGDVEHDVSILSKLQRLDLAVRFAALSLLVAILMGPKLCLVPTGFTGACRLLRQFRIAFGGEAWFHDLGISD